MIIKSKMQKNRKGISIMIGYIFLITITIVISTIVFQQLKTYIPTEKLECPEGVSVFLKEVTYDCDINELNITLKNNGRFSIAGYFIAGADSPEKEIATIDLSEYTKFGVGGFVLFNFISENLDPNREIEDVFDLFPNQEVKNVFDLSTVSERFYSLNIIPIRYQKIENKNRIVSCGDSRIKQKLTCIEQCVPNTCSGLGYVCGEWSDGCGGAINCETCTDPDVCTGVGQCVPPAECTDDCSSLGYQCGTQTICGVSTDCGTCTAGLACDTAGQCISLCGHGIIDSGEGCDDGNTISGDGCSSTCTIESGWICDNKEPTTCQAEGNFNSCGDYCNLFGYSLTFACQDNPNKCEPPQGPEGGIYIGDVEGANETFGNSFCLGDPFCCCQL